MSSTLTDAAFQAIAIDDEGRACRDIPESACREEAGNFFTHALSLTLSKLADGLIDPKLVLSWLLTALGAPVALIGLLVPVREAGALLPQLFTAGAIRRMPQRKWAWAMGSAVQGLSVIAIGVAALTLSGAAAGWAILGALTVLALARSVCSVSYKDVLGKTVSKSRRGRATGLAGSFAAAGVLVFAALLVWQPLPRLTLVTYALFLAGLCWIAGSLLFTRLTEDKGATEGGQSAIKAAMADLGLLASDKYLRRFIAARGLLIATALAPPFMIALMGQDGGGYEGLGFLVFASAGAGLLSSFVWGRLSDQSSRKVLALAALISAVVLSVTAIAHMRGWLSVSYVLPALLFVLMIAYQGVRLGRSTHLVDMATPDRRAAYTALSNTIIGLLLIAGSGFSLIANAFGPQCVIIIMAAMCAAAIPAALSLKERQA